MMRIFVFIILIILVIYTSKLIVNQKKKASYLEAGKKWEGIVKELRDRK